MKITGGRKKNKMKIIIEYDLDVEGYYDAAAKLMNYLGIAGIPPEGDFTILASMIELSGQPKTKVICLCGSTRFTNKMLIKQWELTKQGVIVLSWCALPESYYKGSHIGDAEGVKEIVDEVHKRKIDLADEVLVINIFGYIGDSTRSEIEYAESVGVPVKYMENETHKQKGK